MFGGHLRPCGYSAATAVTASIRYGRVGSVLKEWNDTDTIRSDDQMGALVLACGVSSQYE